MIFWLKNAESWHHWCYKEKWKAFITALRVCIKIRSYFSKNSLSWSGEYCWFFKDYGVKLHISPISLIFGDQLILLGRLPWMITTAEILHLNKDFIKSLTSGKRPRKTVTGENGNHASKMGWEDVELFKSMWLYVYICLVTKITIWIRHNPQWDQV